MIKQALMATALLASLNASAAVVVVPHAVVVPHVAVAPHIVTVPHVTTESNTPIKYAPAGHVAQAEQPQCNSSTENHFDSIPDAVILVIFGLVMVGLAYFIAILFVGAIVGR